MVKKLILLFSPFFLAVGAASATDGNLVLLGKNHSIGSPIIPATRIYLDRGTGLVWVQQFATLRYDRGRITGSFEGPNAAPFTPRGGRLGAEAICTEFLIHPRRSTDYRLSSDAIRLPTVAEIQTLLRDSGNASSEEKTGVPFWSSEKGEGKTQKVVYPSGAVGELSRRRSEANTFCVVDSGS